MHSPEPGSSARDGTSTTPGARSISAGYWKAAHPGRLDPAGFFYGTTLRVYDPGIDAWHILWSDPLKQLYRRQIGRARGQDIVQEGRTTQAPRSVGASPTSRPTRSAGSANTRATAARIGSSRPSSSPDASRRRGRRAAPPARTANGQGAPPDAVPSRRTNEASATCCWCGYGRAAAPARIIEAARRDVDSSGQSRLKRQRVPQWPQKLRVPSRSTGTYGLAGYQTKLGRRTLNHVTNGAPVVRRQIEQWQLVSWNAVPRPRSGSARKSIHPAASQCPPTAINEPNAATPQTSRQRRCCVKEVGARQRPAPAREQDQAGIAVGLEDGKAVHGVVDVEASDLPSEMHGEGEEPEREDPTAACAPSCRCDQRHGRRIRTRRASAWCAREQQRGRLDADQAHHLRDPGEHRLVS